MGFEPSFWIRKPAKGSFIEIGTQTDEIKEENKDVIDFSIDEIIK